jgi:hypothetical protein
LAVKSATVSVVMPARNAAAHSGEAIASMFARGGGVEGFIVADDGSANATRLRLAHGVAYARPSARTGQGMSRALPGPVRCG